MKHRIAPALLAALLLASTARAEVSGGLDWSAWQRMPVLQDGRIMPLDSYARAEVKKICGETNPMIGRLGTLTPQESKSLSPEQLKQWVKESQPRRFLAAELLYAWRMEPDVWEDRQFLEADNAQLRSEVLGVPLVGEDGSRLTHVSPRQVRASAKFKAVLDEVAGLEAAAAKTNHNADLNPLQESAAKLASAVILFDQLCFDPARSDGTRWHSDDAGDMFQTWNRFERDLPTLIALEPHANVDRLVREIDQAKFNVANIFRPMRTSPATIAASDAVVAELRRLAFALSGEMKAWAKSDIPDIGGLSAEDSESIRGDWQIVARTADNFAQQTAKFHWGLYDARGVAIFVAPSLEPTALEADRHRSEIHPWISLQALLEGSPKLLQGYPSDHVRQIRAEWNAARAAYLDRDAVDHGERFSAAMGLFTARVRAISEEIEPARQNLPIVERDKSLLAKTAYPSAIATDTEVFYNSADPFHWAWITSLIAAGVLGVSYVALRKPLFWLGVATLIGSVALLASGFAVRIYITHWAPVTSMFETIVWVSMCVAVLSLWMTFIPLLGPTSKIAWSWTAIPGSWEDKRKPLSGPFADMNGSEAPIRAVALALRLMLFLAALYIIGVIPSLESYFKHSSPGDSSYGGQDYGLVSFLPRADIGSTMPGASSTLVWLASMFVAGALTWYVPRLIPSALMAIIMSIASARRADSAERMSKIYSLRVVAMAGAAASFFAALAANYAPFPRDIQALQPVLRSNFWLGIHVLTITTSYAGAAAAWMIGNLALAYYIFGRYRTMPRTPRSELLPSNEGATDELGTQQISALKVALETSSAGVQEIMPDKILPAETDTAEVPASQVVALDDQVRRPPAFCGTLANLNYRVLQVTVLLISAGTILGGLWADVSWGRFWGWDPKEVGALIALLILLTALHGRRAGWSGDLSLAIGSVMGFFGVLWAWYVVNFLLNAGMHSYGAGEGGRWGWLVAVLGGQFLLIFAAVFRVIAETRRPAE